MISKSKEKILKIISILSVIAIVVGLLVGKIYSTNDNHYVLDVIRETATTETTTHHDDNLQLTEKIVKGENEQYYNSKELDYEVELKNIAQESTVETQVAMVIDTSYSMETNDTNNVVKEKAIELASGILTNVTKSRISISNYNDTNPTKVGMTNYNAAISTNINTITTQINALVSGEGSDSNIGLDNAINSFSTTPITPGDTINRYIIVFTDSTDDVKDKLQNIDGINVINILVDMTSNSYIVDGNTPVCGEVYLLLSEITESDITDDIEVLNPQKIYDNMNKSTSDIVVSNEFSNEILTYFDISDLTVDVGTAEKTTNGYTWSIDKLNKQNTAKLKFKLTLKTEMDIDAGVIFKEIYTNKTQDITYKTIESDGVKTLNGTDSRDGTESTVIKINQGYDLKIKAVNESNTDLQVEKVEFKVVGTIEKEDGTIEEVCNLTRTTDAYGYITITADEARALRMDGEIVYTVTPTVNLVGYSKTDSVQFAVNNDKITRKLKTDDYGNDKITIKTPDEEKRLIDIEIAINSQRIDFELRLEELNNSNVTISGAEFELIQPKLNNKYEMDVLSGTTDETGTIHFEPTVMTKDGTYNYILRQVSAPDGYDVTALTLITIEFKDGKIQDKPSTQFNPDVVSTELCTDAENHTLIVIGNENVEQDPFDLEINLSDSTDETKLEGVTYLIKTTNSKGQTRQEYVTTDSNGQVKTKCYGDGNLRLEITEQAPKVGYVADTKTKGLIIVRNNKEITVLNNEQGIDINQDSNKENLIVNLKSEKKVEQNIVKISLVDSEEQDAPIGEGVVYYLTDMETKQQYGPAVSDRKGELSFTIDTNTQGQHMYSLEVDEDTLPDEYDNDTNVADIIFNLVFDKDGYIESINTTEDNIVLDPHASTVNNADSVEYTAFIELGYEMNIENTTEFKIQLLDQDNLSKKIEGASYNIDIEWDINGVTRTKTIKGRKTNAIGQIMTRIVKGNQVRINVTQVGTIAGYSIDNTTQEIYLTFNSNGVLVGEIQQSPYDMGKTNTDEPNQGAYKDPSNTNNVIYQHLNRKRTTEDTYLNLTISKQDVNGGYVDGVLLNIKSTSLLDKSEGELDLIVKTGEQGSNGTFTIDYASYLQDKINNEIIRVPGIGEDSNEIVYDLEISEVKEDPDSETGFSPKSGTTFKARLIFKYRDGNVKLTSVEPYYGNRLLVSDPQFSSSSDTEQGQQTQDAMGVYLANVTIDLKTNYDDIGNLSIDFKKEDNEGEELAGAEYSLKVINPDSTVIRKDITINNSSSEIEISGISVNVGSRIELTEKTAPIGYGVNTNTEILEVTEINNEGEITLEQKDIPYNPNRLKIEKLASTITASGSIKTNYEVRFVDYQLDTFGFGITAKDSETQKNVEGYTFKIDTDKGATKTLTTSGAVNVGGTVADGVIKYTITEIKVAEYYKPLQTPIYVNAYFDEFGKIDIEKTQDSANQDANFNKLWKFTEINPDENNGVGKIGIEITVNHQEPLTVKVETIDKKTNTKIQNVTYRITESKELPGTGTDTIQVGYVVENGTKTYKLQQTDIANAYEKASDKKITITYINENIDPNPDNTYLTSLTTEDSLTVTGNKEITIKVYVEPKVLFEINNAYYFNTDTKLQGSNFEITSQRNNETVTGTTDANGTTSMYSDIYGPTDGEEVIYKIRQTKGAIGYGTVEDFYAKITYGADREITKVTLTDEYGTEATNNRFVTISTYISNNKEIVKIQVLNYTEFKILIENVDRRDGTTPIAGTEYSVKSTYIDSENNTVDFTQTKGVITNSNGIGTAHLDKTKDNTVVTYTVTENIPATGYQSLGTEIKVIVTFDENGYVSNVAVENDSNLSKIESASKVDPVVNPEDNFVVNLQLKNNPILKFNLTAEDSVDHNIKIKDLGFQIVSRMDDTIYSNSSATNRVNQKGTPETSYTDVNGYTAAYLDRTIDNKDMYYTIKEVQKSPGYEWANEDIIIKVSYAPDGKISSITPTQGTGLINITGFDADNFEINIEIYNEEIKEFGIHLTAVDTYDKDKKLKDMKVEAFLTEPGNNSYVSDGKYELVGENSLLTGADRNEDGAPDLAVGEDYKTVGAFKEGTGGDTTRTLRLIIKNDSKEMSRTGYYLNSYDDSDTGNNIGYYKGTTYYGDAKYETVKYEYLITVTFDPDGKIKEARLQTGLNIYIGWLTDNRYIQVDENGYLSHTDYTLNITMKFFPTFNLKVSAMDNYTYQSEIDKSTNRLPNKLKGAKYTISTLRHYSGATRQADEYIKAGYIGYGNPYGIYGSLFPGDYYEGTDEIIAPIQNDETRLFFVFEESEPTNYQKTNPRYMTLYEQRLVAIIQVTFDQYGEIDYNKTITREVKKDADTIEIYEPWLGEDGSTLLSDNNVPKYNYYYHYKNDLVKRDIDFYIGYALTTTINVTAADDISGNAIGNIRMTPFINNTYCTNTSYEYNTNGYRDTNSEGQFSIKYWGAAEQEGNNQYIIGSSRLGDNYNGYLFPSDMASTALGGSQNEQDYYAKIDITYNTDGKIANVKSLGSDLWGDDNVKADITWDPTTGNVNITMLYSRKFQMSLNKIDYYDSTINKLVAKFDVISDKGLKTSINSKQTSDVSKELTPMGKVYANKTVKYTLSETQVPEGYYPLTDTIDYYVTFDKNGNIGKNTVKSSSNYFEVVNTSENTEKINKTEPDLTINIKDKPAFNLQLKVIDKFYKNLGISDVYFKVTNDKGDTALGNPQTDENGYADVVTGPVYPGEIVKYYISQTSTAPEYYTNSTIVELQVEFNNAGKVQDCKVNSGNEVINNFNTTDYLNKRQIDMQIMNMPKDLKIGLYKYDKITGEAMPGVKFTITGVNLSSNATVVNKQIITGNDGTVIETIDTFSTSISGKSIKYTIHEDETPTTYRTMEDIAFIIRYNADGSIAWCNEIENDNGVLSDIIPKVAKQEVKYLNNEKVHMLVNAPNDNAYDVIIKNEDENYDGLGVEGSKFDVSINGTTYTPALTDSNGKTIIKDLTQSGDITIKIAQKSVGEGYKFDVDNNVEINLEKGVDVYSIDLKSTTDGFIDDKNATTTKAIVEVDEQYGTITVTFKNVTESEIILVKQDAKTKTGLENVEYEVVAQQVDNDGNEIGVLITLTTQDNKITDEKGQLYFELGIAPQSQIWKYTFREITTPTGYEEIEDVTMTVTYDQYGRISEQKSSKDNILKGIKETENENCRKMIAIIQGYQAKTSSGDGEEIEIVPPAYTVKVVTEDSQTGKRINGSSIELEITQGNGELIPITPETESSIQNGSTAVTGNLGIDGKMYTDEEKDEKKPIIIEKGLIYIDNIDYEGTMNIEVNQKGFAPGYVGENQKTEGNIQINTMYTTNTDNELEVEFEVIENDGIKINADNTNRMITITILNESQVLFNIVTQLYQADLDKETQYIPGVNYNITSEIQTAIDSTPTELNATTPLSDTNGKTKESVGSAYAGKTVVYTLHQNTPLGYKTIDDIQVEIHYDSKGYIKYYELLSSEDNAYIDEENTTGRNIALVVQNRKELEDYVIYVEKHTKDTDEDEEAYRKLLPNAKYRITVNQQYGAPKSTSWVDVTNQDGLIKSVPFNGYGYISVSIQEIDPPEGYALDEEVKYLNMYRNKDTGYFEEDNANVGFRGIDSEETEYDSSGNRIITLLPVNEQRKDKFTLVLNKISNETNKYITDNQAEFKAELVQKDEDGNITYQDSLVDAVYTEKNGKATIDNLKMPPEAGEYKLVVTELKAPEGYIQLENNIEIPVTFGNDQSGNIVIIKVDTNVEGLENISTTKVDKQILGINIGNDIDDEILDDEYSLDITKVDGKTEEAIEATALFKVWLPDANNTTVYTETMETLLGVGKLDYCWIEQDKDYQVRLTHMKLPDTSEFINPDDIITHTYTFREVVAPNGYAIIPKDIELNIQFAIDETTGEMYIKDAVPSDPNYLKIKTETPCPTNTRLEIDILNNKGEYTIHYDANDNGEGTLVPANQAKTHDVDVTINKTVPVRTGYIFKGWATTATATEAEYQPGDTYTNNNDLDLYAIWELEQYIITYDANDNGEGTQVPNPQPKTYGVDVTLDTAVPERRGYIFKGWATIKDATEAEYQPEDIFANNEDTTLYAIWEEILYVKSSDYVISNKDNYIEDAKLTDYEYKNGDTHILGILPKLSIENEDNHTEWTKGTTLDDFKKKINTNADSIKIYDENNNEITDNVKYIGTSMIVEFTKGNQTPIRLAIAVRGDINGDGVLNLSDITKAKKYIKNDDKTILDTITKEIAYDTNLDGRLNMKDANNMARAQSNDDTRELNN